MNSFDCIIFLPQELKQQVLTHWGQFPFYIFRKIILIVNITIKNNEAIIDSLFFCSFSTALSERFTSILKSGITTLSPFTTKSEAPEIGLFLGVCTAAIVSLWSLTELLAFFFTTAFHQCYSYN